MGGEQARNEELRQRRRHRKNVANQRKSKLYEALDPNRDECENMLLNVYDSMQEEVYVKTKALENTQGKVSAQAKMSVGPVKLLVPSTPVQTGCTVACLNLAGLLHSAKMHRVSVSMLYICLVCLY